MKLTLRSVEGSSFYENYVALIKEIEEYDHD